MQLNARSIYSHHFEWLDNEPELKSVVLGNHNKTVDMIQSEGVIKNWQDDYNLSLALSGLAVNEFSVWNFSLMTNELKSSIFKGDKLIQKICNINDDSLPESEWENLTEAEFKIVENPVSEYLHNKHILYLEVDLNLPDYLLQQQFNALIKDKRAKHDNDIKSAKRRPDFDGWIKAGVLPYIDLNYWAKSQGVKITNRCMADAIFPHGEGGEEVVRKTTQKLAKDLLTGKYLLTLNALAKAE